MEGASGALRWHQCVVNARGVKGCEVLNARWVFASSILWLFELLVS